MKARSAFLTTERFNAQTTGTEVEYKILLPPNMPADRALPLIMHFHAAMSSSSSLEAAMPAYERAWAEGTLPAAIVVCASTPTLGGFYINHPDGPQWESLISDELPELLSSRYALAPGRGAIGFSMGGYGALKAALRNPKDYRAVAALCPAIFPAETSQTVPKHNRPSILNDLNEAMGADAKTYSSNSVHSILRGNTEAIRSQSLQIFVDCGEVDEFNLHDGALYLRETLTELAVPHTFHSVPNAGHADALAYARQDAAVRFIGEALFAANRNFD
ncbi:esterase [Sinorhizobium fredii]|uniref:Esterase n=1 Tax=Rhizobium fredii TaxID=380 RepID=A0A2A6LPL2_RHIFR|nr:alpha/beta hydrolase-fold protein [Sinorhizobium fredii]PDT44501.1 esterase [Sinorhizobium fredii]